MKKSTIAFLFAASITAPAALAFTVKEVSGRYVVPLVEATEMTGYYVVGKNADVFFRTYILQKSVVHRFSVSGSGTITTNLTPERIEVALPDVLAVNKVYAAKATCNGLVSVRPYDTVTNQFTGNQIFRFKGTIEGADFITLIGSNKPVKKLPTICPTN